MAKNDNRNDGPLLIRGSACENDEVDEARAESHFHKNVIPDMKCENCGKTAGSDYRPLTTKYPEWMNV